MRNMHRYATRFILVLVALSGIMLLGEITFRNNNSNQYAFEKEEERSGAESFNHYLL